MIDPAKACLWIPDNLKKFKLKLFNTIGEHIKRKGGAIIRNDPEQLRSLPDEIVPIIGCHPMCRHLIDEWAARSRNFVYWDRGYVRRIFATWLPRGENGGYYRWHLNSFQMQTIREVPDDRWRALKIDVRPWARGGRHVVIAAPTATYSDFHSTHRWTDKTVDELSKFTSRPLVIRSKESKRPLEEDLKGAHALVTHGSNAAAEAVILGCPVFVDKTSAAALVGLTDLSRIETPKYPERAPWLSSLAYSQFNEDELVNGTLWRLMA